MSAAWRRAVPVVVLLAVIGVWFALEGQGVVSWTLAKVLRFEAGSLSLTAKAEFNLGFGFDPRDPACWVAAGNETARLLVAYDSQQHQLRFYSLEDPIGTQVSAFGGAGMVPGQFMRPVGLAMDDEGNVWVADEQVPILRKYTPHGELLEESETVANIKGWQDVAILPDGRVVSTAAIWSDLSGPGLFVLGAERLPARLRADCLGPVASDEDGNIYVLDHVFRSGRAPKQYLLGLDTEGRTRFERRFNDSWLRPDIVYWPSQELLLIVNSGSSIIEATSLDGQTAEVILNLEAEASPPMAVVPMGDELLVIFCDGKALVYELEEGA
ncbi:MAG: hypothetical protein AB1700_17465 [Bacillota bacterium]